MGIVSVRLVYGNACSRSVLTSKGNTHAGY